MGLCSGVVEGGWRASGGRWRQAPLGLWRNVAGPLGPLQVADFGFAKMVKDKTYTLCGTPEYLAPELVQGNGAPRDWP